MLIHITNRTMPGFGVCTSCGASADLNDQQKCPHCAGGSMESQPAADSAAPAESDAAPEEGDDEASA